MYDQYFLDEEDTIYKNVMWKPSCMTNTLSALGSSHLNYPDAQACPKLLLKNTYPLLTTSPQSASFRCLAMSVWHGFYLCITEFLT